MSTKYDKKTVKKIKIYIYNFRQYKPGTKTEKLSGEISRQLLICYSAFYQNSIFASM